MFYSSIYKSLKCDIDSVPVFGAVFRAIVLFLKTIAHIHFTEPDLHLQVLALS